MKKQVKIYLSLALAVITIFSSFSLYGCNNSGSELPTPDAGNAVVTPNKETTKATEETTAATTETEAVTTDTESVETSEDTESAESETEGETEPVVYKDITIFADGKTDLTIVTSKKATSAEFKAATDLKEAFSTKLDTKIEVKNESFFAALNGGKLEGHKIVVGALVDDEYSQELAEPLRDDGYIITVKNGTLYIISGSDDSIGKAVQYFVDAYLKNASDEIFIEEGMQYEKYTTADIKNLKISGNEIWKYDIIFHDNLTTRTYAEKVQTMIADYTGYTLPMHTDSTRAGEYEILVGDTTRTESISLSKSYASPNLYYDAKVVGKKLVLMGEGYHTLTKVMGDFENHLKNMTSANSNMTGSIVTGDVKSQLDNNMLDKASGTEIRVLNFNVYGATYDFAAYTRFESNEQRGEMLADIMLAYNADIITTNELYVGHDVYRALYGLLSEHYIRINSEYDTGYPANDFTVVGNNPEQIFIKKSCNFKVIDSGWRYLSEVVKSETGETIYPVTYHGIHWAVLQNTAGKKFIVSVGHYGESNSTDKYAREHKSALDMAQSSSGSSAALPIIAAGDFFTHSNNNGAAYKYLTGTVGLSNPQKNSSINMNSNTSHSTCHDFGVLSSSGAQYDYILYKGFTPLKFKVLKCDELKYASDHYPVCVDLKLN